MLWIIMVQEAIADARYEMERTREEFERAMKAAQILTDAAEYYAEEELAEDFKPERQFWTSLKPSIPGHMIPWYTTGFE